MAPVSRCIWSPVGQTPQIRHTMSRVRYSALVLVTVPRQGEHSPFYFSVYPHNVHSEQIVLLLKHLLCLVPGLIVLVWGNAPTHRAKPEEPYQTIQASAQRIRAHPKLCVSILKGGPPAWKSEEYFF